VDQGVPVSDRTYIFLIFVTPKQVLCPATSCMLLVRMSTLLGVRCQIVYYTNVCSNAEFRKAYRLHFFPLSTGKLGDTSVTIFAGTLGCYFYAVFPHEHMDITSMPHCLLEHLEITSIAHSSPAFFIFNYAMYSTVSDHGTECVI
jgi:hypothetical protein